MYNATADVANAATHNGSPDISQSKKRIIFFSRFLHFRGTFLSLCWGVQAFILNPPLPQRKINTSLLSQSSYQHENPAHAAPHTSHKHIFPFASRLTGQCFPTAPLQPTACRGTSLPTGPELHTHLSGYCWGNWPLTPPLGNWCRRRQKCAAYSLLHWRKRSPVPSIDLIFPPLCSL